MKRGFTLIELLIVVAIIAILAAIAVPNFIEAQVRAKVSRMHADMRSLSVAIESYVVDNNDIPLTTQQNAHNTWTYSQCPMDFRQVPGTTVANPPARRLTTPIAYMSSYPVQPFQPGVRDEGAQWAYAREYSYWMINFQGAAKDASNSPWGIWTTKVEPQTPVWMRGMDAAVPTPWLMVGIGPSNILDIQEGGPAVPVWGTTGNVTWVWGNESHYQAILNRSGGYVIYDPTNGTTSLGLIYRYSGGLLPK